jgi:hypothetical protein
MLTSVLRRTGLPILLTLVTTLTWPSSHAIGSFQTKPAFSNSAEADDPPLPTITSPHLSAGAFVGGCGKGRVSDPQTHGCRGPADVRNIAR